MSSLPLVVLWGLKATPLLAGAWLLTALASRASAATRHFVWVLAIGGALLVPVVGVVAPRWEVTVPAMVSQMAPGPATATAVEASASARIGGEPAAASDEPTDLRALGSQAEAAGNSAPSMALRLPSPTTIWAIGAVLVALLLAISLWGMARLARRSRPESDARIRDEVRRLAQRLGVRRPIRMLRSSAQAMPMTWGALRPTVLLPASVDDWPTTRREAVLLHELAHVKRLDWLTQLMARLACVVYWWHPLAWIAARRLREEREVACDDLVLTEGTVPSTYAGDLLELAQAFHADAATSLAGVAMARRSQLAGRLLAVLDAGRARGPIRASYRLSVGAAALAILLPLAGISASHARVTDDGVQGAPPASLLNTLMARPAGTEAREATTARSTAQAVQTRGATLCDWSARSSGSGHSSASTSINDEHMMVQLSRGDCSLTVRAQGEITFTDDDRDIAALARRGSFEIEERLGQARRRVEVSEADGSLERRWFVDGGEQTYGDAARAWLGDALLVLARRAGINAEARAVRIFESQGADGLIAEIAQLESDYVASKYYRVLFDRAQLSSPQLVRLLNDAAARIDSDYEMGRVLRALADHGPLDQEVQRAYVRAADGIDSDYEHGRALGALVASSNLDVTAMDAIFASAGRIDSDYERARLMLAVADRYPPGRPLPAAYLNAVGTMESDHERGRVLGTLLNRGTLSSEDRARVLEVVTRLDSDHTKGELLLGLIENGRLDATVREPFFRAVGGLESSYERQRVLTAVGERDPDEGTLLALLDAARGIDSDHSKAEVLISVANRLDSDRTRSAYARVAETIGSRYDRDRALEAAGLRRG